MQTEINIAHELAEIGKIIDSANLLAAVRKEVHAVMREGAVVLDARQYGTGNYRVVVKCGNNEDGVMRRIRANMPHMDVGRIVAGVLGVRNARRVKQVKSSPKSRRSNRGGTQHGS